MPKLIYFILIFALLERALNNFIREHYRKGILILFAGNRHGAPVAASGRPLGGELLPGPGA